MSYSAIRTALQARLAAVTGMGTVFTYLRWTDDDVDAPGFAKFIQGTAPNQHLSFAQFTRTRFVDSKRGLTHRNHDIVIFAFYSASDADATENTFQDLMDAVANDLEGGDRTLGGACAIVHLPEVSPIEYTWFGPVFCHAALIRVTVEEILPT